jgi:hypothetical protein
LTKCQELYISLPPRSDIKIELKELIHALSEFFKAHPSSLRQPSQEHCSTTALLQSLPSKNGGKIGILSPQKARKGMRILVPNSPPSRLPLPFPSATAIHRIRRLEPLPGIALGRSQPPEDPSPLNHRTDHRVLDSLTR